MTRRNALSLRRRELPRAEACEPAPARQQRGAGVELHIAALPFPSHQGTQAAIASMLAVRVRGGVRAELFTYGAPGYPPQPGFTVHRTPPTAAVSLRSGPSLAKLVLDVRMIAAVRELVRRVRPSVLIAHHVEAMLVAASVPDIPRVFFAHTDLAAELPTYAAPRCAALWRQSGRSLDRWLCRRAGSVAVISPLLGSRMSGLGARDVRYVPTPWPVPEPMRLDERRAARRLLGLAPDQPVALYAGNLDAYQDAERALEALQLLAAGQGSRPTLLLATRSEPRAFLRRAVQLGVAFRTYELADEAVRRLVHAAADFAIVPRAVPGGLPIKLLDALARGLACATMPCALAGLALADSVVCARAQTAPALATAISVLIERPELRGVLGERARRYVASEHNERRFALALERVIAQARGPALTT